MKRLINSMLIFAMPALASASTAQGDDELYAIIASVYLVGFVFYLIPTFVAFARSHPNRWIIAAINIALGGTGIAWLVCLVWAFSAVHRSPTGNHGGESGLNLFVNDEKRLVLASPTFAEPVLVEREPAPINDLGDQLLKLRKLRDSDVISEDEYQTMRTPIIAAVRKEFR